MRRLRWTIYAVTGPGISDDDDHVGRGLAVELFGRWLIEVQLSTRRRG